MKDTVLILTNTRDESAEPVIGHLRSMHQPFVRFDTEEFPKEDLLRLSVRNTEVAGKLLCSGMEIDLSSIKAIWRRRPMDSRLQPDLHPGCMQFIRDESETTLWSMYSLLADAFWMNHPLVGSRLLEHNKLYQLKIASSLGLATPQTLVTNNPQDVLDFVVAHQGIAAMKIIKGNFFSKEGKDGHLFVFTQRISEEVVRSHFEDLRMAPVMIQEYVPKALELRVTVVGEKVFACAIHSQDSERTMDDWRRYDFENVKHEPHALPADVEAMLVALLRFWGLSFGACDLILTPEGEYVFLEINPNGQWYWIEQLTGMPISRTIAETLSNAPMHLMKFPY
jgi:glutathione synthase/RimK-type ligase-like ATP-grasp enzyme